MNNCVVPREIVSEIIELSKHHPSVLANLCLVCKWFLAEAQPVLYRHCSLDSFPTKCPSVPDWNWKLLMILDSTPYIAGLVKGFSYHFLDLPRRNAKRWRHLCGALHQMVNLKSLSLNYPDSATFPSLFKILSDSAFQLEEFSLSPFYGCLKESEYNTLVDFLKTQSNIEALQLKIKYEDKWFPFPPTICPKLRSFSGASFASKELLSQRTVEGLASTWTHFGHCDLPQSIQRGVSKLRIWIMEDTSPLSIAPYLKTLEVLMIKDARSLLSNPEDLANICKLQCLRIFVVNSRPDIQVAITDEQAIVDRLCLKIPTFERAYFKLTAMPSKYFCWQRETLAADLVDPQHFLNEIQKSFRFQPDAWEAFL